MAIINYDNTVIFIRNLYKSFGNLTVLNGIDLDVYQGENVVVLGRSGSGKSVLIKIISGLLQADSGDVKILNQHINNLTPEDWNALRMRIGFSFQNSALYDSMTVRENLEFPLTRHKKNLTQNEINNAVEEVLDDVGLLNAINQMPSELSGGQRKRIGIARTLILKPEIMLYDEPTAGLDPITSIEINSLINNVQEKFNTSAIIITHDLTCARTVGNRVAMLLDGKFLTQGSFEQVFANSDPRVEGFYNYNFTGNQSAYKNNI
ncbi:MAG: ATP-binding cassette domain-containing protein [Parafilimonas sp.]